MNGAGTIRPFAFAMKRMVTRLERLNLSVLTMRIFVERFEKESVPVEENEETPWAFSDNNVADILGVRRAESAAEPTRCEVRIAKIMIVS
jgi:hypothetical protein